MPFRDGWPQVWACLSDEQLQETLRDYLWLAKTISNAPHEDRIEQSQSRPKGAGPMQYPVVLDKKLAKELVILRQRTDE